MSKFFEQYEKRINNVTKGYESILEQDASSKYAVRNNISKAIADLKDPSKLYTLEELKNIQLAISALGIKEIVNSYDQSTLQNFSARISKTENVLRLDIQSPTREKIKAAGVKNKQEYVKKIYGSTPQDAIKAVTTYSKLIRNALSGRTTATGQNVGTFDSSKDPGIGFTLGQLQKALEIASDDLSITDALSQVTGQDVTNADVDAAFTKVSALGKQVQAELASIVAEAEKEISNLQKKHAKHPDYNNSYGQRILQGLEVSDIFRSDTTTIAYVELRAWAQSSANGEAPWIKRLVDIIPTVDAITPVIDKLKDKRTQFELTQIERWAAKLNLSDQESRNEIRKLAQEKAARSKAGSQEKAIRDAIRQAAEEAAERKRAGEEEAANRNFIRDEAKRIATEKKLAAEQEKAIRDAIRDAAEKTATDNKAAADQETSIRDAIRATAARIAKENKLATEQETAIRDAIRQAAEEAAERFRAGEEEAANRNFIRDEAKRIATENKLAAEQEKAIRDTIRIAAAAAAASSSAARDQDFLGDPEDFGPGTGGTGRAEDSGGFREMAKREFDKAIANTPGPTRGNEGAWMEMAKREAKRAYETALKNTPGPTRGDGWNEFAARSFEIAIKNTPGPTRGGEWKEVAKRAFSIALANTADTGRGSGQSQVDRRFIDNVKTDVFRWFDFNPAPITSGSIIAIGKPGDDLQTQAAQQSNIDDLIASKFRDGERLAGNVINLASTLSLDSVLFDSEKRLQAVSQLKEIYVKHKALEKFIKSQEGTTNLLFGLDPDNLTSIEIKKSQNLNYNRSSYISYALELVSDVIPRAIQKHSTDQDQIDNNKPTPVSTAKLDQRAEAFMQDLIQGGQPIRDRQAAADQELSTRDAIRDDAKEKARQKKIRDGIIADQYRTFQEIEAETTSNEEAFNLVMQPLEALLVNAEKNVGSIDISDLIDLQNTIDNEYNLKGNIILGAINGKAKFEELDERLNAVINTKWTNFTNEVDSIEDTLVDMNQSDAANIDSNFLFSIQPLDLESQLVLFEKIRGIDTRATFAAARTIDDIQDLAENLKGKFKLYNSEVMMQYREIQEQLVDIKDDITNVSYDEIATAFEQIDDLFELIQSTANERNTREQDVVESNYQSLENLFERLVQAKYTDTVYDVEDSWYSILEELVNSTKVSPKLAPITGRPYGTGIQYETVEIAFKHEERFDEILQERDIIRDFYKLIDATPPNGLAVFDKHFDRLDREVFQLIKQYRAQVKAGRETPGGRGVPNDEQRYGGPREVFDYYLSQVKDSPTGPDKRQPYTRDQRFFPIWDKAESEGKSGVIGDDIGAWQLRVEKMEPVGVRGFLGSRRRWQLSTGNYADNPQNDPFVKHTMRGMRLNASVYKRGEITSLRNRNAAETLDSYAGREGK